MAVAGPTNSLPGAGPVATVVVPVRNAARSLEATVASLQAQTDRRWIAVIVDDGSDDDSASIIAELAMSDDRIVPISIGKSGVSGARNAGLAHARTDVVVFLDADDTVEPDWLSRVLAPLLDDDRVGLVCCGSRRITPGRADVIELPTEQPGLLRGVRCSFLAGTYAVRRELLVGVGGFTEPLAFGENTELGIRLVAELSRRKMEVVSIGAPLLKRIYAPERVQGRERDRARVATADWMLDRYANDLRAMPGERSKLHRIAAVNSWRVDERRTARRHAALAWRISPLEPASWTTLASVYVRPLARRWERTETSAQPSMIVVGSARSGTTLLATLIDSHPEIGVPGESGFLIPELRGRPTGDVVEVAARITDDQRASNWGIDVAAWSELAARDDVRTTADLMRVAYDRFAAEHGATRVVDKTPEFIHFLPRLSRMFPATHFAHLVRDGRDVALSWLDGEWGVDTVEQAAYRWDLQNRRALRAHRRLSARSHRLRYEDLVAAPADEVRHLCARLGLEYTPDMVSRRRGADRAAAMSRPEYHQRLALPPTAGLRDWRRDMSAADVRRFDRIAGRTLRRLGYTSSSTMVDDLVAPARRNVIRARRMVDRVRRRIDASWPSRTAT
jgi:Sulfotransferase family/Glycosyl transferase family 2